ncbi:DUF1653 domain-containing protein [Subtercola frigoramans]|uniref:DUF1653 domain-containing protein n=1 Tax=Subtercola frigoramans TaxID=120298 RepID=A0ABS2L4D8_9MICO|nr:DUF1653 domain-containing protein [Subtercola frigoramans]MBM7471894.1 hypothetical protein [Subtercola frigoramans]
MSAFRIGLYRHFKGNLYEAIGTVLDSETEVEMVLYRPVGGAQLWVRSRSMFEETVNRDGVTQPRFAAVDVP